MAWQPWIRGGLVLWALAAAACDSPPPRPGGTFATRAGAADGGAPRTPPESRTGDASPLSPVIPDPPASHIEVTLDPALAVGRAVPGMLLSFPYCIPSCTIADQPRLMADTTMEDRYLRAIEGATGTIDFSTFTFGRPRLLKALIDAADRGLRVRGIVDRSQLAATGTACTPAGCSFGPPFDSPDFLARSPRGRFEWAESNGAWPQGASLMEKLAIVLSGALNGSGVRRAPGQRIVHNKLALVDGEVLVNGSPNWSTTGLAVNLETLETATLESDPEMLRAFSCMFEAVFTGDPQLIQRRLPACQTARIFFSPMPALRGVLPEILRSADEAATSIDIAMHHFTSPEITSALVRATRRGVKVRMMLDDDDCMLRMPDAMRALTRAGAELRYLGTSCELDQLQHDKFGVFDGRRVINGPANWTKAGIVTNYENFVVHTNPSYVGAFEALFERAWTLARPRDACGCDRREPTCRERFCLDRQRR